MPPSPYIGFRRRQRRKAPAALAPTYDNFDDDPDERVDLLMNKLSDIIKPHTTEYLTLNEVETLP